KEVAPKKEAAPKKEKETAPMKEAPAKKEKEAPVKKEKAAPPMEPVAPVRKIVKIDETLLKELPEVPKKRGGRNLNKFRK
ncbi:hypothetical protein BGX33_011543, partial [Mortierella sp. NVP41]